MKTLKPLAVALVAGAVTLGAVPLAHATFRDTGTTSATFGSDQLAAPTAAAATVHCTLGLLNVVLTAKMDISWTRSTSGWASGQRVVVTDDAGLTVASQDLDPSASSTSVDLPLSLGGTSTATVRATYSSWTSTTTSASASGCSA